MAVPGDTILIHEGTYSGGLFVGDLQGTSQNWIYILAQGEVVYNGGTNAWQFSDGAYLHIRGFTFRHQTGNGLNIDDGGSYESPAHHIIFEDCIFGDLDANGNNDLLKVSGLDSFEVRNCTFVNGASGGSGIDMVGCHDGLITGCYFENMGSNAIQAKGGTHRIRIERNVFKNAGQRSLNLGGSTGLPFFRPIDAPYEAAEIRVYANVFIGSVAPVAFVGCINSEVVNNTIYLPERWALRILQETVDETRFPPCGYNTFRNNIIYLDNRVSTECNMGPNTAPETFTFSNNLWYRIDQLNWNGPVLPVTDADQMVNEDALFIAPDLEDFRLQPGSPAIGNGYQVVMPEFDFIGHPFAIPRAIGAFEGADMTSSDKSEVEVFSKTDLRLWPNPVTEKIAIQLPEPVYGMIDIRLVNMSGQVVHQTIMHFSGENETTLAIPRGITGAITVLVQWGERQAARQVIIR